MSIQVFRKFQHFDRIVERWKCDPLGGAAVERVLLRPHLHNETRAWSDDWCIYFRTYTNDTVLANENIFSKNSIIIRR